MHTGLAENLTILTRVWLKPYYQSPQRRYWHFPLSSPLQGNCRPWREATPLSSLLQTKQTKWTLYLTKTFGKLWVYKVSCTLSLVDSHIKVLRSWFNLNLNWVYREIYTIAHVWIESSVFISFISFVFSYILKISYVWSLFSSSLKCYYYSFVLSLCLKKFENIWPVYLQRKHGSN